MTTPKIGDKVWFISKFKDCVTGTFIAIDKNIPGATEPQAIVESFDAFGEPSKEATRCIVPIEMLRKEESQ